MTITKDLQAISKELTKLVKQTEKLAAAIGKAEKPKVKSVKTKTKAKAVSKKAPAKGGKKFDTDRVLSIDNRSKKGVGTITLMKKIGFNQKKIRNILQRTYKQGKITSVEKRIYIIDFDVYQPRNPKASAYYLCVEDQFEQLETVWLPARWAYSSERMSVIRAALAFGSLM